MRKTPNLRKIGLFTIGGIVLFLGIIGFSVGDKLFVPKDELVVFYFEESVKGLSVGSPVVFNGVEVGKVTSISLDITSHSDVFKIPVVARLEAFFDKEEFKDKDNGQIIKYFVNEGLRASLINQNLLTGQLMIELEFEPKQEAIFRGKGDAPYYTEIPTVLSGLGALTKDIKNIPVSEVMHKLDLLLTSMNQNMPTIMTEFKQFSVALNNPSAAIGSGDSLIANLNMAVQNIGGAARSLRNFADYIERNPQALLTGKGRY